MSDRWQTFFELQRQAIEAQQRAFDAGSQGLSDTAAAAQEAMRKAAQANVAAWSSWAKLWGIE